MRAIILAAGQGTRLRPHTDDRPKCMVSYQDKAIIDHILETMNACSVTDITIVTGYKSKVLENYLADRKITFCHNNAFATTNMVSSLFCAENRMDDDLLVSYSDIIYSQQILKALIDSRSDFSVVIDKLWRNLWEIRMEDPLTDAETLILDQEGNIRELGQKPKGYHQIEGQYLGLIKISKTILPAVRHFYHSLDQNSLYDGKDFHNMYMTSFIQLIIDHLHPVRAVPINGNWLEIDSTDDLNRYAKNGITIK